MMTRRRKPENLGYFTNVWNRFGHLAASKYHKGGAKP